MAYQVKNTAGTVIATVADNHIDKDTTSLALVGYKATKYGLDTAENFVHLLEHFANASPPENPIKGQLWYDTNANGLRVYTGDRWAGISGTPSVGDDPTQGGIAGVYHCPIPADHTSVLLLFAGGKIVAVIASKDIDQANLPPGVQIEATEYPFQSLFPFGLQAGVNLADDNDQNNPGDYVFSGRVPLAEQAHFAGGGVDDAEVSGWGYMDLGPGKSVGLMISAGNIVAAVSSNVVLLSDMPNTVSFYVKKDRDTGTGTGVMLGEYQGLDASYNKVTIDNLRNKFPAKDYKQLGLDGQGNLVVQSTTSGVSLFPGLTFASVGSLDLGAQGSSGQLVQAVVAAATTAYGTGLASAIEEMHVWVDNNSATAQKVTSLEATFTTLTGTTSVAEAIEYLLAQSSDTGAVTAAITDLKAEFTTALGTSSFGEALTKLQTTATATGSNSQAITDITSQFTNVTGQPTFAQAVSTLWTQATEETSVSGWGLSLNSNGYITGIEALNGGASNNYFKVIASNFFISDNNIDFLPFQILNGVVYMKNVVAENITYGSLVPMFGGNNNKLDPANGFQVLPGGFIIQWGQVRQYFGNEEAYTVTFPIPFPNNLMSSQATAYINYANRKDRDLWMQTTSLRDRFSVQFQAQATTANRSIDGFDWIAFGY